MPSGEITAIDVTLNPINNYAPTQWQTGDIVSSEKLNKIENNVGPFVVKPTTMKIYMGDNGPTGGKIVTNASYNDIKNAVMAGRQVLFVYAGEATVDDVTMTFCETAYLAGISDIEGHAAGFISFAEPAISILQAIAGGQSAYFSAPNDQPDEPLCLEEGGQQSV